jgi:CRISPR/Cas system-associated exonuclease Cas4 (RecB family)
MAFADILKTFKKPEDNGGVLAKVDRYLLALDGKMLKDKEDERAKGCYHPSELSTNPCTRSMTYRWIEAPAEKKAIQPRVKRIFDVGHHFGFIMQQYFWDMDILEGDYECVECKHEWWDTSPKKCPNCKTQLFIWDNLKYNEIPIRNEDWNITGHADGILVLDGERVLIELKSIKNRDKKTSDKAVCFEDLSSAKTEHVHQANLYMDARGIDRGIIIYFAKNTQETKEFPIRRMDMMLTPSYNKIVEVEEAKHKKVLPPRAGRIKSDPICMYCPFKQYCWGGEHTFEEADRRVKNA